ncbi:tape measure protein [Iningainema tapete]|uniref:Tape measure protein n=1 Tax=Iningainema tapete BLCC-T55 TaxID=2748662 RepID=A0A8J7BW57_9CYAN|nr:tape measure protein [Iningainema tapete]MBD2771167.1 tape measure protein [Iningainema tapete BLCC-T55]
MTSVGSVSIELKLDRSGFDKEFRALSSEKFEPIPIKLELDTKDFEKQIKGLQGFLEPLVVPIEFDTKGLAKQFKQLKFDCIPICVCPDLECFERELKNLDVEVELKVKFDSQQVRSAVASVAEEIKTQINTTVEIKQSGGGNSDSAGIESAFAKSLDNLFEKQQSANRGDQASKNFVDFTLSPIKAVNSALQSVVTGAFENIGRSITGSLSKSLSEGLDNQIGQTLSDFGKETGKLLGVSGKELGIKGGANQQKNQQQSVAPNANSGLEDLKQNFKTISTTAKNVSDVLQTFGVNIGGAVNAFNKAGNAALSLAGTFSKLQGSASGSTGTNPGKPNATTQGFLTGEIADLTPLQAKAQTELATRKLSAQLAQLKQLPKTEETRSRIAALVREIADIEKRMVIDIANSDLPTAIHRSLGQLKAANSALIKLKNEAARLSLDVNKLTAEPSANVNAPDISLAKRRRRPKDTAKKTNSADDLELRQAESNFRKIFTEIARMSGVQLQRGQIPGLRFGQMPNGVAGLYDPRQNNLNLSQDLRKRLATGTLSREDIDTIAHEARHALQLAFGRIKQADLTKGIKAGVPLTAAKASSKALDIEASVQEYREAFKQKFGKYPPQKLVATIRKLETDAYTFAEQASKEISDNLASILQSQTRRRRSRRKPLSTQLPNEDDIPLAKISANQIRQAIVNNSGVAKAISNPQNRQAVTNALQQIKVPNFSGIITGAKNAVQQTISSIQSGLATAVQKAQSVANRQIQIPTAGIQNLQSQLSASVRGSVSATAQQVQKALNVGARASVPKQAQSSQRASLNPNTSQQAAAYQSGVQGSFWEQLFRKLEARFYRSQMMQSIPSSQRRSLVSEASGFLFSGAALAAPGATFGALLAPLAPAIAPLAVTFGMLHNALQPLIQTIVEALRKLEPAQKRLEFTAGSKEGGKRELAFATGISSDLNTPLLASLEGYSKLSAAAKGTRLEGAKTRELFEGISTASKALQLSQEDLNLVMFAFTQVLSKGKLTAEEVRLQIAERLPGAINIFAKSLGISVQEFNALLESGSLLSEDVLPKVGRGLREQFGQAAKDASGSFLSAVTRVDNAILKLQKGLADAFGSLFAGVANTFGGLIEIAAQNIDKIIQIAGVALIGIGAQFFVGLTTILNGSGITAKLTAALIPLFARAFATLTPFVVGILADFLDDVFGAKFSVMDNMMKGTFNIVLSVILVIDGLIKKISELFSTFSSGAAETQKTTSGIGSIVTALKGVLGIVPSTVVEFTALTLMLIQTATLAKMALGPVIGNLVTSIKALSIAFVDSVKSGRVFQSSLNTLTAGLAKSQLAVFAMTAAVLLFFAKADFSDELGSKFDKLGDRMSESLDRVRDSAKSATDAISKIPSKVPDFKSKGFDLSLGTGEYFGLENGYRTDDAIKTARNATKNPFSAESIIRYGPLLGPLLSKLGNDKKIRTLAENQFDNSLLKVTNQGENIQRIIDQSQLLTGGFSSSNAGKAFAQSQSIDEQIKSLQLQRLDIVSVPGASKDPSNIKAIQDLEKQIEDLQQQREQVIKPIESLRDEILKNSKDLGEAVKIVEEADLPEPAKQELKARLATSIALIDQAKKRLEDLKAIDLSPLGNSFTNIQRQIEKSTIEFDKGVEEREVFKSKAISAIYEQQVQGKITPRQLEVKLKAIDTKDLEVQRTDLTNLLQQRELQMRDLLAVPSPTKDQIEVIEKTQKEIRDKELKLAQVRIQIAQKTTEGKRLAEEQTLKEFTEANEKAMFALQKNENSQIIGIRSQQLLGGKNSEDADTEIARVQSTTAKKELQQAVSELAKFKELRQQGKVNAETSAKQELDLTKQVSSAALKAIEAEIAAREALKQKRIRDIEEIATKEEFGISQKLSASTKQIKAQQLSGKIDDKEASRQSLDADISATQSRIAAKQQEYDRIKKLRAEGTLTTKQYAERERSLLTEVASLEGQLLDQRLSKQQQYREKVLEGIEFANKKAEAAIAQSQVERNIALKQRTREGGDLFGEANQPTVARLSNEIDQDTNRAEAELIKTKILQVEEERDKRIITTKEATEKILALNTELAQKNQQLIDLEIDAEAKLRDERIAAVEQVRHVQEGRFKLAVNYLEQEKANLDLYNQSLERTAKLEESRYNLKLAVSDAGISGLDIRKGNADRALELSRKLKDENLDPKVGQEIKSQLNSLGFGDSELQILEKRSQIEDEIAAKKLEALKTEQAYQRQSLLLDLQRQKIAAQTAVFEAESGRLSAAKARLEADSALRIASIKKDPVAIEIANIEVQLANREVELSDRRLQSAQENLNIQDELTRNAIMAQEATQRAAIDQQLAADSARKQSAALEKVEASATKISSELKDKNSNGGESETKNPSDWVNPFIQKPGEGLFEYHSRIAQDKIEGRIIETKKTTSSIDTTGYHYDEALNRQQGNPPASDFEFGKIRTYASPIIKAMPGENIFEAYMRHRDDLALTSNSKAYEPLNSKPNDLSEALKESQIKPSVTTTGYSQFVDALKVANSGIEQRLDALNNAILTLANTPRSLSVSTPNPVDDAASILNDISRAQVLGAGL